MTAGSLGVPQGERVKGELRGENCSKTPLSLSTAQASARVWGQKLSGALFSKMPQAPLLHKAPEEQGQGTHHPGQGTLWAQLVCGPQGIPDLSIAPQTEWGTGRTSRDGELHRTKPSKEHRQQQ